MAPEFFGLCSSRLTPLGIERAHGHDQRLDAADGASTLQALADGRRAIRTGRQPRTKLGSWLARRINWFPAPLINTLAGYCRSFEGISLADSAYGYDALWKIAWINGERTAAEWKSSERSTPFWARQIRAPEPRLRLRHHRSDHKAQAPDSKSDKMLHVWPLRLPRVCAESGWPVKDIS